MSNPDNELEQFVTAALLQITNGIEGANQELRRETASEERLKNWYSLHQNRIQDEKNAVHFDIAVTTEQSTGGKAGAEFNIKVARIELGGDTHQVGTRVSRVSFSVYVQPGGHVEKSDKLNNATDVTSHP